jgi:nitrogen fixation protein FixH
VSIASPGREQPYRLAAGADGSWTMRVELRRGANLFDIEARDPQTGKPADRKTQLFITVPFVTVTGPTLRVDQPFGGFTFDRGSVPVQGVARNAERVAVTASPVKAPRPAVPPVEAPPTGANTVTRDVAVHVAGDGFFTTSLLLPAGTWRIEVVAIAPDGRVVTITRDVIVAPRLRAAR